MQALIAPLKELAEYDEIRKVTRQGKGTVALSGCVDSQKLHMIYGLSDGLKYKVIVTYSDLKAKEIYEEYRFYDRNVMLYPAKDLIFFQADIHGNQLVQERIKTLRRVVEGKPVTIVTTYAALMTPQVLWEEKDIIRTERGGSLDESKLASRLVAMGYEKAYQVESPGQFSVRGGIVDIFDLTEENPYRIELWGDEVESIRSFDILSQRSIEKLESITVYPATEFVLSEEQIRKGIARLEKEAAKQEKIFRDAHQPEEAHRIAIQVSELKEQLLEFQSKANLEGYIRYFYENTVTMPELLADMAGRSLVFYIDEPARVKEQADAIELEFRESMEQRARKGYVLPGQMNILYSGEQVAATLEKNAMVTLATMETKYGYFRTEKHVDIAARNIAPYNNSFESLVKDLKKYKKSGYRVLLLSGSRTRARRLAEDLRNAEDGGAGLTAVYTEDPMREVQPGEILTYYGHVNKGFEYPWLKFVVLSESDIFGSEKRKKKKKKLYQGQKINDFNDLKIGDYVVHETHGLGIYKGIEKVEVENIVKDYLKIEYRDGGNLYILATGLDVIQKYASADAAKKPKLNKLGGKEWEHTKTKVRSAVSAVAKDLVELYAVRQQSEDTVWQREFEEMFPFEETEDQLSAIADTKADMESHRIMDRLICGDVGYGKTEIAIRAAFKAVQEGKQVAYLVPTTVLASQHFTTFEQRMKDFPVTVAQLSSFRTSAQNKETIEELKKGMVDIVIGTHRLLSKDVVFKDLGLLIIDEEQRFGVTHKEKIKKLKNNVDVLTLSATPIPRTLHMSLAGIRDMSVLEEPPVDRVPIQTFVTEHNDEMIREAITRELARNGQVYYVYNRVRSIDEAAAHIQELVPDANVAYAHGQMAKRELEKIMCDFVNGEIDVLVSTTIIETGMDISNCNTMIIEDADRFGLSQLYQLRGRVGRSSRTAYAFLLYRRDKVLTEVAEKRLSVIREFADFGSGFKIAMKDLEIRGAGNVLGNSQHGHMAAVGYDLYCKMLNQAVNNLKGIKNEYEFETTIDVDVDAYIPATYIKSEYQKLDIYKRIAALENMDELSDMKDELSDRYGSVPSCADNLLMIALIKSKAHKLGMIEIKGGVAHQESGTAVWRTVMTVYPKAELDPDAIKKLLDEYGGAIQMRVDANPAFIWTVTKKKFTNAKEYLKGLNALMDVFIERLTVK